MIGILCEKPSAARNFAKALGGQSGTFDGQSYVIASARGHLFELAPPNENTREDLADKYKVWDLESLPWNKDDFCWRYQPNKEVADISKTLSSIKKTLSACDTILIGTDVDPTGEGELLAWEIIDALHLSKKKIGRMYFMDESENEIRKAFRNWQPIPSKEEDADYRKAYYRTRWDYLSMQWTRIGYNLAGAHRVVRFGRLKSAMVKIVGDGLAALAAYVPIPFFENRFHDENKVIYSNPKEERYKKKEDVPNIYEKSPVVLDKKEMKSTAPPRLIDLAALSSRLASKGFRAAQVLSCYQAMYEDQVVSYPRTEDKTITPEQFNELLPLADRIAAVVGADASKLTHKTPRNTHVKVGGAHGANRPGICVPESMEALEAKYGPVAPHIYRIVAKSYLAMLAEDYIYERQTGHLEKYPQFVGATNVPKSLGWKAIFPVEEENEEDEETSIGLGKTAFPFVYEGVNKKPPTPTMRWLMKQLEKNDVGTGATRTSTYADITSKKSRFPLLVDTKGKITMAECGEIAYGLLPGTYIGDLRLTEGVLKQMREIAAGRLDPEKGLSGVSLLVSHDLDIMRQNAEKLKADRPDLFAATTPKEKYECTWEGKPAVFSRVVAGYRFSDEECERLAGGGEVSVLAFKNKAGESFGARGKLAIQEYKGIRFLGFMRICYLDADGNEIKQEDRATSPDYATGNWNGKEVFFKRTWSGHTFTEEEIEKLLAGEKISFEATAKSGKEYTATGKLALQTYNGKKFIGFKPEFNKARRSKTKKS